MIQRVPLFVLALLAGILFCGRSAALAQTPETLKGNTITVYICHPPGGGYDVYGRLLARHLGKHLPGNPNVVVSNMPGAQGAVAANFLYYSAPKDGSAIAILSQDISQHQVLGTPGIQFDVSKFGWIGRIASNVEAFYVWHTVPVNTFEDVLHRETIFGSNGPSIAFYLEALRAVAGARVKIVLGYSGTQSVNLAMERGEVEGTMSSLNTVKATRPYWLQDKKIKFILQLAAERFAELRDVPAIVEFAKTPEDRILLRFLADSGSVGRSFAAPPDTPPERLSLLRAAFDATMRDEQLRAEISQSKLEYSPMPGADLENVVRQAVNVAPNLRDRLRAIWSTQ